MLNLPPADHTPLKRPPLPLVVGQARFSSPAQEVTQEVAANFQSGLREAGFDLPKVRSVEVGDVFIGPSVRPTAVDRVTGVQLTSKDDDWIVTLVPGAVSLETPSFSSFAGQFGPLLAHVLHLTNTVMAPITLTRAGLRFVNVLHRPDKAGDWSRWVRPALVAAQSDELLGSGVISQSQQLLLGVERGVRSAVRAGNADVDGEEAYLLDIDTFAEPSELWTPEKAISTFDDLNRCGVAVFQGLISTEMLSHLLGSGVEGESVDDH